MKSQKWKKVLFLGVLLSAAPLAVLASETLQPVASGSIIAMIAVSLLIAGNRVASLFRRGKTGKHIISSKTFSAYINYHS